MILKNFVIFGFLFFVFYVPIYCQVEIGKIQQVIDSIYVEHPESIGLLVHIEHPTKGISHTFTAGYTTKGKLHKLEESDVFLIASNVKTYTSAAILRIIENGALKLTDGISDLISEKSRLVLEQDGYLLDDITVYHLLSHTSGIADYVGEYYMKFILENKDHRWTRDEQIALSVKEGDPLGKPGEIFKYADVNFILLTEIIENKTNQPFYKATSELLRYNELDVDETWYFSLDDKPLKSGRVVHQYWSSKDLDSWEIDPSFDLYGAGGIASTARELCEFSQNLFNGKIVKDTAVLNLIFTPAVTADTVDHQYHLGLQSSVIHNYQLYGHGGFWGTVVQYIPALNASISIAVLERDKKILRRTLLDIIIPALN